MPGERQVGDRLIVATRLSQRGLDSFWQNLQEGVESIRFFSEAELGTAGVPTDQIRQPDYLAAAGMLSALNTLQLRVPVVG